MRVWGGRAGCAGHAVNPSLGARWRHPWRQRSCAPRPASPRQFPAGADASNPRREQGRKQKQKQKQKQELRLRLLNLNLNLSLNLNLNLISLLPATPREKEGAGIVWSVGERGRCKTAGAMGPRHAPGGLGRTPNPDLAVCAGQRTRARRLRAPMDGFTACFAPPPLPNAHTKPTARFQTIRQPATKKGTTRKRRPPISSPRAAGDAILVSWDQLARPPPPPWPRPRPPPVLAPPPRRWP